MPRTPRLIIPGAPLHVTHRGVDRRPTFLADDDRACYLDALRSAAIAAGCAVHAYVLMTNHVHLLATTDDARGAAAMMQALGTRYVRYFNHRYGRTGTLWEGRYRSAVVTSAAYFFACSRYIELNPVRAGLVGDPTAYRWSSVHANAGGADDPLVTPHALYRALGAGPAARRAAYRASFAEALCVDVIAAVRTAPAVRPPLRPSMYQQVLEADSGVGAPAPIADVGCGWGASLVNAGTASAGPLCVGSAVRCDDRPRIRPRP